MARHIKTINVKGLQVSKKAYEGLSRKARILSETILHENDRLLILYESKSGRVRGEMRLNHIKTEE